MWVGWAWIAGCAGPTSPKDTSVVDDTTSDHTGTVDSPTDGDASGHTGVVVTDTSGGTTLSARCAIQANSLRFDCRAESDPPQAVDFSWQRASGAGAVRERADEELVAVHDVPLWFFAPDTDYVVHVSTRDGLASVDVPVRTGSLPTFADVVVDVDGTSSAELFLTTSPCPGGGAVVWEADTGEVVWAQQFSPSPGAFLEGVGVTDAGTVLTVVGANSREVEWDGDIVRELRIGTDYTNRVHHDVFQRAGLTYLIFQEPIPSGMGNDLYVDGFYVFDTLGYSWEFHLVDFYAPDPDDLGVAGADWSHANAVWADASGDVYLSLRHQSTIVKIEGDPLDPDFGRPIWRFSGDPESRVGNDFTLTSSGLEGFHQQHNVHVLPSGQLTMFDNRVGAERSRIVDVTLDEIAMTATMDRIWDMPGPLYAEGHCDFQGGAWRTAAGNPVGTCSPFREGVEFDAASGDVVFTAQVSCQSGSSAYVPRFVPVE